MGHLQCSTGVLLQGWQQHPIRPPFLKYDIGLEGGDTIVFTALEDLVPQTPLEPGIKQIHLILKRFRNPHPGHYRIHVAAETGPGGALETGWGQLHIIPQPRPSISVTSAFNGGTPNTIYQGASPGELTPLSYDLLLWDSQGLPMTGVTIAPFNGGNGPKAHIGNLVQDGRVVGKVHVDAPKGATGFEVFTTAPLMQINSPISGIPTAHMEAFFRAGTTPGEYATTFILNGGNSVQMFVTAQ